LRKKNISSLSLSQPLFQLASRMQELEIGCRKKSAHEANEEMKMPRDNKIRPKQHLCNNKLLK
jgi:hypothetical protein